MIDVLIDETGNMVIAHDCDSLPRLSSLSLDKRTGELRYRDLVGGSGMIGTMLPAMVTAASGQKVSTIIQLEGFQVHEPYRCDLDVY